MRARHRSIDDEGDHDEQRNTNFAAGNGFRFPLRDDEGLSGVGCCLRARVVIHRASVVGSSGELKSIEQAILTEVDRNDGGEAGARSGQAKLLKVVIAAEAKGERPRACADVDS